LIFNFFFLSFYFLLLAFIWRTNLWWCHTSILLINDIVYYYIARFIDTTKITTTPAF
jgi:hypothetical protein